MYSGRVGGPTARASRVTHISLATRQPSRHTTYDTSTTAHWYLRTLPWPNPIPIPYHGIDNYFVSVPRLRELKDLLDGGVLTQEEFDAQKKAILEA